MAVFESQSKPKTGLKNYTSRFRRSVSLAKVTDPSLKFQVGSSYRADSIGTRPPYDFDALRTGYLADSYIRQGVDKYAEVILKEGFRFDGEQEPVDYLIRRLDIMSVMGGEPWQIIIDRAVRDFCKFGNIFLVVKRTNSPDPIPGMILKPPQGKRPIGAYFNLPVNTLSPELGANGEVINWIQRVKNVSRIFSASDVLHFTYCKEPGGIWGASPALSVIEDIRALRQCEENVLKLIYKSITPLIHQQIPDITGNMEGRAEDIDDAIRNWQTSAPDGFIVTPPGHKLSMLGAESHALRVEAYLEYFKKRVFTGLGVSELSMGEGGTTGVGGAEVLTAQMIHRAKMYQVLLATYFTNYILNELLVEGGYDPWNKESDRVVWAWNEIDIDRRIKEETHTTNLWTMNLISLEEAREKMKLSSSPEMKDFYVHQVQIPQLIAGRLAMDPLDAEEGSEEENNSTPASAPSNALPTKIKPQIVTVSKTKGASKNLAPKIKPGAPTAHKMNHAVATEKYKAICEKVISLLPRIREEKLSAEVLNNECFLEVSDPHYTLPLCIKLIEDANLEPELIAYARVNARLTTEETSIVSIIEAMPNG